MLGTTTRVLVHPGMVTATDLNYAARGARVDVRAARQPDTALAYAFLLPLLASFAYALVKLPGLWLRSMSQTVRMVGAVGSAGAATASPVDDALFQTLTEPGIDEALAEVQRTAAGRGQFGQPPPGAPREPTGWTAAPGRSPDR